MDEAFLKRFWSKVDRRGPNECWPWLASTKTGYGQIWIGEKYARAHRISFSIANGPILDGRQVCHSCDNKLCVNPKHLWLGSAADNAIDRHKKGRSAKGENHGKRKLTAAAVYDIRNNGAPTHELVRRYGISRSVVKSVRRRAAWVHLP